MPDRVLLIGAAGLVGNHVVAAFADRIVAKTVHRVAIPGAVQLDVRDLDAVRSVVRDVRPTTIILCAADANVERCELDPDSTSKVNVSGTENVAALAREMDAALVVFSSEYVFDGRSGSYTEDDPTNPMNEYGRQKVLVEEIARSVDRHLVVRTANVFGWEALGKNFVCQVLGNAWRNEAIRVAVDQTVVPTYAGDLAATLRQLADLSITGLIHVVGAEALTRFRFAQMIIRTFDLDPELVKPAPLATIGFRAPRPREAILRDDRLRRILGHRLSLPAEALAEMRKRANFRGETSELA